MAGDRQFEIDELFIRPGTYFNPQTEVMLVVDDSPSLVDEIFNLEEFEGADWVLISDELPVDDAQRDEIFETFQATHSGGDGRGATGIDPETDDEIVEPEPDPDQGVEELE